MSTGKVIGTIGKEDDDSIIRFSLSPNNKWIVVCYRNGLIKQLDVSTPSYDVVRSWKSVHVGSISTLSFDSSAVYLATGGTDSTIKIWDLVRQYCTHNLKGARGVVSAITFQKDEPSDKKFYVFGAADDCVIHIWNLMNSKLVGSLEGHSSKVTSIEVLSTERIISASRDKLAIIWNVDSFSLERSIPLFESVESVLLMNPTWRCQKIPDDRFDPDHTYFITSGEHGILKVWDLERGSLAFAQPESLISSSSDSEDDFIAKATQAIYCDALQEVVVLSYDRNIIFHRSADFSVARQLSGNIDEVLSLALIGEKSDHLAVATNSSHIRIYDLETSSMNLIKGHSDIVLCLEKFSADPYMLVSGSKDNSVIVWKFDSINFAARIMCRATGHSNSVTGIACSLAGSFILSVSEDTTFKLWPLPETKKKKTIITLEAKFTRRAHDKLINTVSIAPNDKLIATGGQDKLVKLWQADTLSEISTLYGHRRGVWRVRFSPVDQILASSSADMTIKIWSLTSEGYPCIKTLQGSDCSPLDFLFLSRGMQIVSALSDGNIKLWDIKTTECTKTIDAHLDKIWSICQSNDESVLVSGSADACIIVWQDVTAEEKELEMSKMESLMEQEQSLSNFLRSKKWRKALKLTILLDQPFRTLNVIKEILLLPKSYEELDEVLSTLRHDELVSLLRYAVIWNTSGRNYYPAQRIINHIFILIGPQDFLQEPNAQSHIEGLFPYTEKHLVRINKVMQNVAFANYLYGQMRLPDAPDATNDILVVKSSQPALSDPANTDTQAVSVTKDNDFVTYDYESDDNALPDDYVDVDVNI